jgi:hypothetical protein
MQSALLNKKGEIEMMGKIRDVESSGKFIAENFISFDKENVIILDIIENNREELGL